MFIFAAFCQYQKTLKSSRTQKSVRSSQDRGSIYKTETTEKRFKTGCNASTHSCNAESLKVSSLRTTSLTILLPQE